MDLVTKEQIKDLLIKNKDISISIFLPTERSGKEAMQGKIRLKNLLKETENTLEKNNLSKIDIDNILKKGYELVDDTTFWQYQKDGLALFITDETFEYFKVPVEFKEISIVSDQFYIVPLLSQFTGDGEFYLLSLNQNNIKLFQCSKYQIEEVDLGDTPKSLSEAMKYDVFQKEMNAHSSGRAMTMLHGMEAENPKNQVLRFFQMVNEGVLNSVENREAPLVLAGVKNVTSIYRRASKHPNLIEEGVEGNPEDLKKDTLHEKAWNVISSYFKESYKKIIEDYEELKNKSQTTNEIDKIAPAAFNGRVKNLILVKDFQQWGNYREDTNEVDLNRSNNEKNKELLNFSAIHTFLKDGDVYMVNSEDIPGNKPYIATLRY